MAELVPGRPAGTRLPASHLLHFPAYCLLPTAYFGSMNLPVSTYEGMFLLDSAKVAVSWDDSVKQVHDILTKHQSEIVASRQSGRAAGSPIRSMATRKGRTS